MKTPRKVRRLYMGFGDVIAPSPAITCAYPFDASEAEVIAFLGATGRLALSNENQTGTHMLVEGIVSYAMAPGGFPNPTLIDLSTGTKVVEVVLTVADLEGAAGVAASQANFIDLPATSIVKVQLSRASTEAEAELSIIGPESTFLYQDFVGVGVHSVVVGVEFNSTAGTMKVIAGGVELTLSNNTYVAAADRTMYGSCAGLGIEAADAGKINSVTFRTNYAAITQTYSEGATDICGNPLES